MSRGLDNCLCLDDFEARARQALPRPLYGYVSAAAEDGVSHRNNLNAFGRYAFVQRALVDVSVRDASVTLFGQRYAQPFGMAPMGLSALYTYRGDVVLAETAARRGIPMIMSSSSLIPLEAVAQCNPNAWFQAYVPGEPDKLE